MEVVQNSILIIAKIGCDFSLIREELADAQGSLSRPENPEIPPPILPKRKKK